MKVVSSAVRMNENAEYAIKNELDREELDIICEAMTEKIHKGIADKERYDRTVKLYGELFALWEATSLNQDTAKPLDPNLFLVDVNDENNKRTNIIMLKKAGISTKDVDDIINNKLPKENPQVEPLPEPEPTE